LKDRNNRQADREARRRELYKLLGDMPDRERKISVSKIGEEKHN